MLGLNTLRYIGVATMKHMPAMMEASIIRLAKPSRSVTILANSGLLFAAMGSLLDRIGIESGCELMVAEDGR